MTVILNSHQAELGQILRDAGITADDVAWSTLPEGYSGYSDAPALLHKPSGYWFGIADDFHSSWGGGIKQSGRRVVLHPGEEMDVETVRFLKWPQVAEHFRRWVTIVKREMAAPTFWEALQGMSTIALPVAANDSAFSREEQKTIQEQLSNMEAELAGMQQLQQQQAQFVKGEFRELNEQLRSMKKGQWAKLFLGTLARFAMAKIFTHDTLTRLIQIAEHILRSIGAHYPMLPPV